MNELAAEVFDVAAAEGIRLEGFDAFDPAAYVRSADPVRNSEATDDLIKWLSTQTKTRSGIWRDIAVRHRPTEVPTQYEPVIDVAARHGLYLPLIEELVTVIRKLETGSIAMDEEHLARLDRKAAEEMDTAR